MAKAKDTQADQPASAPHGAASPKHLREGTPLKANRNIPTKNLPVAARPLTPNQMRFAEFYAETGNVKKSAERANITMLVARKLMADERVWDVVELSHQRLREQIDISRESVIAEYARMAYSNLAGYYDHNGALKPFDQLSENQQAAIQSLKVSEIWEFELDDSGKRKRVLRGYSKELKLHDKIASLGALTNMLGYGTDPNNPNPGQDARVVIYLPDNGRRIKDA